MSDYINDALLDASPYKKQAEEAKALVNKWDKTGLLDGLNEDFQRSGMAVMLENQAKQLISEASGTGGRSAGALGGGGGANSEEWSGVALPLVRRIFGEIAAQDFVSVQPMNLPSGLVFYLDFKYGKNVEGYGKNSSVPGGAVESMQGKTGPSSPGGQDDQVAPFGVGGLYGEGRYDYSIKQSVKSGLLGNKAGVAAPTTGTFVTGSVTFKDINFNQEHSASLAASKLSKVSVLGSDLTNADFKAVRSFNITQSGDGGTVMTDGNYKVLPQFTTYDGTNVNFIVSASGLTVFGNDGANAANEFNTGSIEFTVQPTESDRGDFEDTAGNATVDSLAIPEVDLQLKSSAIVAKTRKLKAVWSPELAQDLNAYHSVDAEAELTSMLSEYISMEIDLEILDMLVSDAATTDFWSATPGEDYDGSGTGESNWNITTFYGTRYEWYQTLLGKIQKVSNEIQRLTLRGGANFVVVSPTVATILESIPGYTVSTDGNKSQFAAGVQVSGTMNNRFTV